MAGQQGSKAMSIRLSFEHLEDLEILAFFDRCSLAEEIRQAIANHIEARRTDEAYITQMRAGLDRMQRFIGTGQDGDAR